MSSRPWSLIIISLFISSFAIAQDYNEGFAYLEGGEFAKAKIFFKKQLDQGNNDVTAQLCYGRALGLSGGTKEANKLFDKLVSENPDNYELKLNYAESFMWDKDYTSARSLYDDLVTQDTTSFPATLGYANALSSLKEYEKATTYVEKALNLLPENANAIISKKYITLGLAESRKLDNREQQAIVTLEKIDPIYPNDIDLGLSLAYLYMDTNQLDKSENRLASLEKVHGAQSRIYRAMSNLKLRRLEHKAAIDIIKLAKEQYPDGKKPVSPTDLESQIVGTLVAGKQYEEAESYIKQLEKDTTDLKRMTELWANLALGKREYDKVENLVSQYEGTEFYEQVHARMELQKGNPRESAKYLNNIDIINPESVFHYYFTNELNKAFFTTIKPEITFLDDNGGNHVRLFNIDFESTPRFPIQVLAHYDIRNSQQDEASSSAQLNMLLGLRYHIHKDLYLEGNVGSTGAKRDGTEWTYNFIYASAAKYKFSEFHNIKLSYQTNFFDYNVALINSAISENRYAIEYYNKFTDKLGVYTNLTRSDISDDNTSDFIFISLFHNFTDLPLTQVGVNVQSLSFTEVSPVYFSPDAYRGGDVFAKYDNRYHPLKKWVYGVTAAIGLQKINDTNIESIQRIELEAGYKINAISWVLAFFRYNNAASANVAGFQVTQYGINGMWRF